MDKFGDYLLILKNAYIYPIFDGKEIVEAEILADKNDDSVLF